MITYSRKCDHIYDIHCEVITHSCGENRVYEIYHVPRAVLQEAHAGWFVIYINPVCPLSEHCVILC